jgi:quercetin dioxygenase-like cupin family protein/DNA-binding XRE family transcriptional regulator
MEEKKRGSEGDKYKHFLDDLDSFSAKDEEKYLADSAGKAPSRDEIILKVGESVKKIREEKGLSLQDISQRTGLQPEFLMEIEEGEISPPLGAIIKLAKALEMKMGYFISGIEDLPYTIVRKNDRKLISRYDSKKSQRYGYEFSSLAPHKKDRHMEPFLVTLEPSDIEERSTHDGQEFIYVLEGTMEVRLGEEVHLLEPGDAIYYDSTVPHLVTCYGKDKTKILAVLYTE